MDQGEEGPRGAVEDEVEEGEIVDEGEVLEEEEEVEDGVLRSADNGRDHQKVGEVQEYSQKASCEKAQEAEESIPSVSSSESVLSEGLQSSEKVAAPKHKKEGKIFSNDEENNVVRQSGLGEEIGKHEKGNFKNSEKWKNLQGVEKEKKSAKNGDLADRFIKVVALTADKREKSGGAAKREEHAQDRKSDHGKEIATGGGQVENLNHARVKDLKQHKEKRFGSTAKDGSDSVKKSTNQVLATSSLSNGKESKEGSGVKVEGSTSKILVAERSRGERKGNENIVEKCVKLTESKTVKKKPLKRGKQVGEVWEGFSFEKPEKVKHERPTEEGKTVEKSGMKRKAEEMPSSAKEEEKKIKKNIEGGKKNSKEEKMNTETEKKSNEAEKESNIKKGTEGENVQKKREKGRYVEEKGKSKTGREETGGKKGQSERLENKSQDTEEKRKGKGGEEKDGKKVRAEGRAEEDQEKKKKGGITCNTSKSGKTNEKKEEEGEKHDSEPIKGKGGREDRSSAKKVKVDEKPKDNAGVEREGNRDGQGDEGIKEASIKCTVEELESWKDEVNNCRVFFF